LDQPTKSIKKINKSIQYNSRENGIIYRKLVKYDQYIKEI